MDVLILRDPRESKKKCSLTPLREHPSIRIVDFDPDRILVAGERILLHPEGDELSADDRELGLGLFMVDCSWRRVPSLLRTVEGRLHPRRLPPLVTAYPRKSKSFADPTEGLASVEALVAAVDCLFEPRPELLDGYRWAREFLAANPSLRAWGSPSL